MGSKTPLKFEVFLVLGILEFILGILEFALGILDFILGILDLFLEILEFPTLARRLATCAVRL